MIVLLNRKGEMDMAKCISCGNNDAKYIHFSGGYVCEKCMGDYFTCPDCQRLFNPYDYEHGDAGTGFCVECSPKH